MLLTQPSAAAATSWCFDVWTVKSSAQQKLNSSQLRFPWVEFSAAHWAFGSTNSISLLVAWSRVWTLLMGVECRWYEKFDFWPISRFISETIQDTAIVNANMKSYTIYRMLPFRMTLSYLEWLSEIFNGVKHRVASLRQLSVLFWIYIHMHVKTRKGDLLDSYIHRTAARRVRVHCECGWKRSWEIAYFVPSCDTNMCVWYHESDSVRSGVVTHLYCRRHADTKQ